MGAGLVLLGAFSDLGCTSTAPCWAPLVPQDDLGTPNMHVHTRMHAIAISGQAAAVLNLRVRSDMDARPYQYHNNFRSHFNQASLQLGMPDILALAVLHSWRASTCLLQTMCCVYGKIATFARGCL